MIVRKLALLALVAAATEGCSGQADGNASNPSAASSIVTAASTPLQGASIEGTWTISQPFAQSLGGGQLMTMAEMRQTYEADGRANFVGRITVTNGGTETSFRISGFGTYELQGTTLTEYTADASVTPDIDTLQTRQTARMFASMYETQPPVVSEIEELSASTLRLRSRDDGTVMSMAR